MNYRRCKDGFADRSTEDLAAVRAAVGRNVRRLRRRRGHTMEVLSHLAGIHVTFIGHIELGTKSASLHTLVLIARALLVPPAALLKGLH